ncbi:MAG: AMP-binding protein [Desulfurivibrionaceae bacterium]|nr:AMP-binding protein [Desulfurivibrionaceae bacterium]
MIEDAQTVQDLIWTLPEYGEKQAIVAFQKEDTEIKSYGDLFGAVARLGSGLAKTSKQEGETVALCGGNSPAWVIAALAVIYSGNVLLPIDQQADRETLEHIFRDSGAGVVFADRETAEKISTLDLPEKPRLHRLDISEGEESWFAPAVAEPEDPPGVTPEQTAVLFYTSGTTGAPKGVPLSHANLVSQPEAIAQTALIIAGDRVLLPLPLHHVYPFVVGMLTPLAMGLPLIFPDSLTGQAIIRAVAAGGATIIIGVPRLYRTLYDGIRSRITERGRIAALAFEGLLGLSKLLRRRFGLLAGRRLFAFIHRQFGSSLRILASGGSALDEQLARNLEGLGWQIAVGYGLTETSPILTVNLPGSGRLGSVGKAIKGVEISIAEATDSPPSPAGSGSVAQTGEVLVRGPNVFGGYLHLPEKTREAFTEEGWYRTGDLGRLDQEGFLYLRGRTKTLMVTESGENLQPDEIEEMYGAHPAIREIGVFLNKKRLTGIIVPDLKKTEPGESGIQEIVRRAVAEKSSGLPSYKILDEYVITRQSLPRTRLGKIRRHLLEERYRQAKKEKEEEGGGRGALPLAEMSDQDQALLEDRNAKEIWKWLSRKYTDRKLTPDSSPRFDLGIDSLEWLDVSLEVQQRTGVELGEEAIGNIETVRDLLEEVGRQAQSGQGVNPKQPLREPEAVLNDEQKRWLQPLGPLMSLMRRGMYHLNRLLMKILFRLEIVGRENLPGSGHYLIAPNHLSLLDPLIITAAIPYPILSRTFFAGWTEIAFKNPFFRFVSRLAQAVPIDNQHAVSSSLAFGSAVLSRQKNLIWFPEGGRSPDGTLQEFKSGVGLLLEHHDVAVVPVYIDGTYEALPTGARFPRFRKITLVFGRPLSRDKLREGGMEESDRDRIRNGLRHEVARLAQKTGKEDAGR